MEDLGEVERFRLGESRGGVCEYEGGDGVCRREEGAWRGIVCLRKAVLRRSFGRLLRIIALHRVG